MEFNHTHLWNNLPDSERKRLMPHMIEAQILHIEQTKNKAIRAHKIFLRECNEHIQNLKRGLERYENEK